jgi:cobalt-zinc-cadmium efflux system protein
MNKDSQPGLFFALWPHAVRILLGGIFIYAGYVKIIDPAGFAKNVYQYQLLPDFYVNVSALFLPWLEVVTGAALILAPRFRRGAAALIFMMLVVFTGAVLISLYRGLDISCGCLSTDPNAAKIGWKKVAENIGLIILSVVAFIQAGRHPSLK